MKLRAPGLLFLAAASSAACEPGWEISQIPTSGALRALALDSGGRPALLSTSGSSLRLSWRWGEEWSSRSLESMSFDTPTFTPAPGVYGSFQMRFDSADRLHVAFTHQQGALRTTNYLVLAPSLVEEPERQELPGALECFGVGSDGSSHFIVESFEDGTLALRWDGAEWHRRQVSSAYGCRIEEASNDRLIYSDCDGYGCTLSTLTDIGDFSRRITGPGNIAAYHRDAQGRDHAFFWQPRSDNDAYAPLYHQHEGRQELVDPNGCRISRVHVVSHDEHLQYADATSSTEFRPPCPQRILYGAQTDSGWVQEIVAEGSGQLFLELDRRGRPVIAFTSSSRIKVAVAR